MPELPQLPRHLHRDRHYHQAWFPCGEKRNTAYCYPPTDDRRHCITDDTAPRMMSSRLLRATSHSSSQPPSSPRGRAGFFFSNTRHGTKGEHDLAMPQTPSRRSHGSVSSGGRTLRFSHDEECLQLFENARRVQQACREPKKMDRAWEVYKELREECYHLCKGILTRTHDDHEYTTASTASHAAVNDLWLSAILEYKVAQYRMHNTLQDHMLAVLREYQPGSTESQAKQFLASKELRKGIIAHWREISLRKMVSEKLLFWEQFRIRSLNFHALTLDILAIEKLFLVVEPGATEVTAIHDAVVSESEQPMLHALSTRGDEAWPLRLPISRVSGAALDLTQGQEDNFTTKRSSRASTGNSLLMIAQSFPSPPTFQLSQELWENSIDYAYEQGAEADCDYQWD